MSSIWYEKYKPKTISEMILPQEMKTRFQTYVDNEDIPSIGLWGVQGGVGKTSLSHAIIKEIGGEAMWINASLERGIDVLRGKIQNFASASSFDDKLKIIVMDEVDGQRSNDMQMALRGVISEFSSNCRFIFTGNYKDNILPQLLNRLENYDFEEFSKKDMIRPIFERLKFILDTEGITYDPKDVAEVIGAEYPSIRKMIGTLQRFSITGELKFDKISLNNTSSFKDILMSSDYMSMVQNVNALTAPSSMYSFIYQNLDLFKPEMLQSVIVSTAKYQDMDSNVRDKHLNLAALIAEILPAVK